MSLISKDEIFNELFQLIDMELFKKHDIHLSLDNKDILQNKSININEDFEYNKLYEYDFYQGLEYKYGQILIQANISYNEKDNTIGISTVVRDITIIEDKNNMKIGDLDPIIISYNQEGAFNADFIHDFLRNQNIKHEKNILNEQVLFSNKSSVYNKRL